MRRKDAKLLERIFFILRKNKVEKVGWQTVGDALSECTGKYVYGRYAYFNMIFAYDFFKNPFKMHKIYFDVDTHT
jgi:hypothetical protein